MKMSFRKILILGNGGSGKTFLANEISLATQIQVLHLDSVYWTEKWKHSDKNYFLAAVNTFTNRKNWIIEGTPMLGLEERVSKANIVIFLDKSRMICLKNVFFRFFSHLFSRNKSDPSGCPAMKLNYRTIKWIWCFNNNHRKNILDKAASSDAKIIIIRSTQDVNNMFISMT